VIGRWLARRLGLHFSEETVDEMLRDLATEARLWREEARVASRAYPRYADSTYPTPLEEEP